MPSSATIDSSRVPRRSAPVAEGSRPAALLIPLLLAFGCATPTLQQRAEGGESDAQIELAERLEHGTSGGAEANNEPETKIEPDPEQALVWYQRAAEQGDPRAELKLAETYYSGSGVAVDYAESERWARRAAERGYAPAESFMGGLYRLGAGVPQDYAESIRWYRLAAESGDAAAQFFMGAAYDFGSGVEPDRDEALRWYELAGNQGWGPAQRNAGLLYLPDDPALRDEVLAFKWLVLAASSGDSEADRLVQTMITQLSVEQISQAGSMVAEYREAHGFVAREIAPE
jgi:TPR repeat protein